MIRPSIDPSVGLAGFGPCQSSGVKAWPTRADPSMTLFHIHASVPGSIATPGPQLQKAALAQSVTTEFARHASSRRRTRQFALLAGR